MSRGTIFITGASTGIGHATAVRLARAGFDAIPGLRRDEPLPEPVGKPVLLDLADADSIAPACEQVLDRAGGRLAGLVNNAGMTVTGACEALTLEEWRRQFDVNLFGHIAVTRALLPGLLAAPGRIVNIGSIGGRMAFPFMAPYNASKFAVRGWSDSLRQELAPFGVKVALVQPGSIDTPLWDKGLGEFDDQLARLTDEQRTRYETHMRKAHKVASLSARMGIPPERCAKVIERALTSRRPAAHYLVGPDARIQAKIAAAGPRVADSAVRLAMRG